ncbi:aldolase/citrate lyase family protein [Acetobacter okinawensis]|uniref:aldolase/citrate lyase family protein n=1 Tax=Acetobacter okinawensis TaxID=1076594 RepID=UPI0020119577|nr:aldolase/citrate lyase family protein [Acetobacter okinawensis]
MNKCEREMLDLLKRLRQDFGAVSVKAEFEAEGTRTDELLRLIDLARRSDLKVTLKVSGCEAVRDLIESKQFGVEYIIAPMVETPYALQKFILAKNKVYSRDQQEDTEFLFNVETITTYNNLPQMMEVARTPNGVQGAVFGRVDFSGSMGLARNAIDTDQITDYVRKTGAACKESGLDLVVGGAVAISSLPELNKMRDTHLTRFETRKVVFGADSATLPEMAQGLQKTVYFELLWLQNKRDHYETIRDEDSARIKMLSDRWDQIKSGMLV